MANDPFENLKGDPLGFAATAAALRAASPGADLIVRMEEERPVRESWHIATPTAASTLTSR